MAVRNTNNQVFLTAIFTQLSLFIVSLVKKNATKNHKSHHGTKIVVAQTTIINPTNMSTLHTDEAFTILTGKISNAINRTFLRTFAREGVNITTEQWSVLACIWKENSLTQQAICNLTGKDKPSMTRLIDNLEKSNLVIRIPDNFDRRINKIQLTTEGKTLQFKATEIVQTIASNTLQGISSEELDVCRKVLKKIMQNIA